MIFKIVLHIHIGMYSMHLIRNTWSCINVQVFIDFVIEEYIRLMYLLTVVQFVRDANNTADHEWTGAQYLFG